MWQKIPILQMFEYEIPIVSNVVISIINNIQMVMRK